MHLNLADTLVVKQQNLFLISLRDGCLPHHDPHPLGLYFQDCRHLSAYEWRLNGEVPLLLQASDARGTRALHELTNPPLTLADGSTVAPQSLSLRLDRTLDEPANMRERLVLSSHHHESVRLDLELHVAADFAPMLAVRGLVQSNARPVDPEVNGDSLVFSVMGRDGILRSTRIETGETPRRWEGGRLLFDAEIPAGGRYELEFLFSLAESGNGVARSAARRQPAPEGTRISSDDELFNRVLARSLKDLDLLRSNLGGHRYFAAGVPWFATLFGRDSLITAIETLSFVRGDAEQTLRLLGGMLGRQIAHDRDEEPGKVLHELRLGEPVNLGETPFARYYGSVDATPLWLCLVCDHADWAGNLEVFRDLRPQVEAALGWIERHGDLDGDALVEYQRRSKHGLANQGWKDSWDGVPDAEGTPLVAPIALVEVQGYVIRALRRVARLLDLEGEGHSADELRSRSRATEAALERFWLEDAGGYAIGLDGSKRPGSGLTSNQGHLLWAGAVSAERAERVCGMLMGDAMFSGWGIRTLGEGHPAFNPLGYHTGTVWPHDNALVAHGLRRYGFDEEFTRVFEAMLEAASQFNDYRLPELFGGNARTLYESPVPYPVACAPQAWAAGAIPYLLRLGLGLSPDGLNRRLRIIRPSLPHWLSRVEVSGLHVAGATIDLCFERTGEHVTLTDARIDGDVEVVLEIAADRRTFEDV
jgi:glycogen debranching enzyme